MKTILNRIAAVLLILCMLPAFALADTNNGTPVTQSDFTLRLRLNPEGFENDGAAHYEDWQKLLNKISLAGQAKTQSFLSPFSRVMLDGSLCLNDQPTIPFEYDGYYSFRYLRSPAIDNASVHFQMFNFFQFMLKPYYFMGLPTNLIAIPLYPEAAVEIYQKYAGPISRTFEGEGTRTVSYDELYALAEELSAIVNEDTNDKMYFFLTCLLIDIGGDYLLLDKLGYVEAILDYLDPEQMGMTITVEEDSETWVLGETTVFEKTADGWCFTLPEEEGYVFGASYADNGSERTAQLQILLEDSPWLDVTATLDGLGDPLKAEGAFTLDITGDAIYEEIPSLAFRYDFSRTAESLPCDMALELDWLNPATEQPAIGLSYKAAMQELPYTAVYDRPIDNQDDFFHLNESFMAEYKERFMPTLVMAALPFVLEVPAGVISDAVQWLDDTGFLAFFGLE